MHHKSQPYYKQALAISFTLSFASMVAAQAAIEYPLNELKVIKAPISTLGLTRIAVKEDRIQNVFGVTGEYVLEADEDQGQIFIRPSEFNNKPIHLTLTTENGHTQDLRLTPQDKDSEPIILKLEDKEQIKLENKPYDLLKQEDIKHRDFCGPNNTTYNNITYDEVENLIEACRDDRIPLGYKLVPISINQSNNLKTLPEPPVLIRELRGEKLRCLTYAFQNTSNTPLTLKNEDFAQSQNTIAVFIPQKTIAPGERRDVYVITLSH